MVFPLFETLCIENGLVSNITFHQQRYEQSLSKMFPQQNTEIFQLQEIIEKHTALITSINTSLVRCRIDYNANQYVVQCFPYQRKRYQRFKPVVCDDIDYQLKYTDRRLLNNLLEQKGDCDEIMIIKKGKITDCSIGNLIFRQGTEWFTPDTPLLAGTQRAKLLNENKIKERSIFFKDLNQYEEIRLINALNPL